MASRLRCADKQTTADDFCRVFEQEMTSLYTLSFLLTADHALAEECFANSLADCLSTAPVFKRCALIWSKRSVIKNAIQILGPALKRIGNPATAAVDARKYSPFIQVFLELDSFARFAVVMSVLERYSDRECALLLRCTTNEVANARMNAIRELSPMAGPSSTKSRSTTSILADPPFWSDRIERAATR
jgi:hypothetical protein